MEVTDNQTTATNVPAASTPATAPASTTTPPAQTAQALSTTEAQQTTPAAPKVYSPNYKFKVFGEEKEFDEFIRPLVKDEDSEKKIRDLYAKAHGLEPLKSRLNSELETTKNSYKEVNEKYTGLSKSLAELSHFVSTDNFDAFFKTLQIPEAKVFAWIQRKIQERELPPEQQAELKRGREYQDHLFRLQRENEELHLQLQGSSVQQNEVFLDNTLASQKYSSIAQDFDARVGTPGAFKMEIIKRGALLAQITGKDLPVEDVITDYMNSYGKILSPMNTSAVPQANTPIGTQTPGQRPPVIPHVQGQGSAPVKKAPRNLQELRALANQ